MKSLTCRKVVVIALIAGVFLAGNILIIAQWLSAKGIPERANWIRSEFLTGTAIAVIVALLILLVNPKQKAMVLTRRCPVCDHRVFGNPNYCPDCGSKV